jgi:hypothetical protein
MNASRTTTRALRTAVLIAALAATASTVICGCKHESKPADVGANPPQTKSAPPTPIAQKKEELGDSTTWDPAWDQIVEQAVPAEMLGPRVPRDVQRFCPRFYQMADGDKRAFWAYFFQALAGAEAGLDPKTNVRHTEPAVAKRDAVTGGMVHSEGLLQLTYQDSKRYGCDFDYDADRRLGAHDPARTILRPKNNLECGVKILSAQIIQQRKPLLARSGYWSTLQPGRVSYRVFAKQMTNPPDACGLHARTEKCSRAQQRSLASVELNSTR